MWIENLAASVLNRIHAPKPARRTTGLTLGRATDPPNAPVVLSERSRCEHLVIVGKTGSGKTYLLEKLAADSGRLGEGFAFFDFHGDSSRSLAARLHQMPDSERRLVVIDPSDEARSPGINVLDCEPTEAGRFRKVSELSSILRQRWGVDSFGARTEELLRNSLYTLAAARKTLAQLPAFLTSPTLRKALTDQLEHPDVAEYWRDRYEPLSEAMKAAFREPLLNKVTAFLTEPAARHLLGQANSTVDFSDAMRHGQWVVIRLPKGRLREHAHTLGNLLFAQLQFAAFARERLPKGQRATFTIFCDEVQNLAENDLSTMVTEGRKFGISVVTANQFWEQSPRELRGCLLSAGSHLCFRVSHADAKLLGPELDSARGHRLALELTRLGLGEAVARLGSGQLARLKVPSQPPAPRMRAEAWEAILARCAPLRADIEARLRATVPEQPTTQAPDIQSRAEGEGLHGW
jgi:hypothetical protein